jgi:hypothetical protein
MKILTLCQCFAWTLVFRPLPRAPQRFFLPPHVSKFPSFLHAPTVSHRSTPRSPLTVAAALWQSFRLFPCDDTKGETLRGKRWKGQEKQCCGCRNHRPSSKISPPFFNFSFLSSSTQPQLDLHVLTTASVSFFFYTLPKKTPCGKRWVGKER